MTNGFLTIDIGEKVLIYDLHGRARVEEGPKRIFLWREKLFPLKCYTANQNQYLVTTFNDGIVEHIRGPCAEYMNPLIHKSIQVKEGISLDANEVLVVYGRSQENGSVKRFLQHGPTLFIPQAYEWIHEFCWHGTDPENKTRMVPGIDRFTKLQVIPDQFYYNVDEVRTADDALIRVKLMMFYELTDIEKMLNSTKDPKADFINCLSADVIAFASKHTYIEFIERSEELNHINNYPQLLERCKAIGYVVSKVVFRGYYANEALQKMHDHAIAARTEHKIAYETEEQEQALTDMKLKSDLERTVLEQNLELEQLEHQQKMESSQLEHQLALQKQQNAEKVKLMIKEEESKLAGQKEADKQKVEFYTRMHQDLQVDMTAYLLSRNPQPAKVTRVVASQGGANLHLHHS